MRLPARSAVLVLAAAAYLAIGPYALVAVAVLLVAGLVASQRIRRGLRPTWKTSGIFVVLAAAVALVVALIPDGRLPIPPGGGMLVTASYVGSPAEPRPIDLSIPQHPGLAVNGSSSMHNDGWATDAYAGPGPLGVDPEVDTAWYGIKECATLAFDRHGRIVALCGSVRGAIMHVLDPESMDPLVTVKLPGRTSASEKKPWQDLCGGAYFYLGADDRAYVETTTRQIRVFETATADGEPALDQVEVLDLSGVVPEDDCLLSLMPDWQGRGIWFATQDGRVGLAELGGEPQVLELGAGIANSMAADLTGLYVVTDGDFFKLDVGEDGSPEIVWSAAYDNSGVDKTGQLSPGSGTTPTVLPNGLVAITDNAEPRMNVVFYDATDGSKVCQEPVFGEGESSTDNSLVAVGSASVVVENNFGNDSPLSPTLGRRLPGGYARVDVVQSGECQTAWTNDEIGVSTVPKVSLANGLLYGYTNRPNSWRVSSWYVTAMDAVTGETVWAVRAGTGVMFNNHGAPVTLAPDGSLYVPALTGMVRVRDGS